MAAQENELREKEFYRNISIHISDRSLVNLTLNIYNCGNQDLVTEQKKQTDYYIFILSNQERAM